MRRVRVPGWAWTLALVGAMGFSGTSARAQEEPSAEALADRALSLADEESGAREHAYAFLSSLGPEWIEAVSEHAGRLARRPLDADDAGEALRQFRHAMGSRRADDMDDIAPGVLPTLAERRDRVTVAMAERIALMRAMEALPGRHAGRALLDVMSLDLDALRWERRRVLHRRGISLLPTLLDGRSHPSPAIRRWARAAVSAVGGDDAGHVVQALAARPELLADTLRAWSDARDFDAMPVVVTFLDDDELGVREAARDAMRAYGRNGVWMLRRSYRNELGEDAPGEWGWRRTYDALVAGLDERRLTPARDAMNAGLAAATSGDLDAMKERFDRALLLAPRLPEAASMAAGYARWADREMEAGRFELAEAAYLRAARLSDDEGATDDLRARALLAQAEAERALGALDLDAYRRVAQLSPGQALAAERLAGETGGAVASMDARRVALFSGAVLAVLGLLLFFGRELPVVEHAARAAAKVAAAATQTLRAKAERSMRVVAGRTGRDWTRSLPLALVQRRGPELEAERPSDAARKDESPSAQPWLLQGDLTGAALDTTPDAISTAPGMAAPADAISTAPGMAAPIDAISTAPGAPAPVVGGAQPVRASERERHRAVSQAEQLGILAAAPPSLDPFEDDDPFEGAELF